MLTPLVETKACEPAETPKRRRRSEWKLVKFKVVKRTWWRDGSGERLVGTETVCEPHLVKVPVVCGTGVAR